MNTQLLRSSFELIVARNPEPTLRFYEILFERYPQIQSLFSRDRALQAKMLRDALVSVLDHLDDAPWLQEQLGALGAKHVDYGVTDEMYPWVGDALLATLAEIAGEDWSDELHEEWAGAYGAITGLMLSGARAAAS